MALAAERHDDLRTFSIGFDDPAHSETAHARRVAERFKTRHQEAVLAAGETRDLLGRLRQWYDEPFADTSAFPTFLVSRWARESVTVALSGDGGDELFGGYRWYSLFRRLRPVARGRGRGRGLGGAIDRFKQRLHRTNPLRRACNVLSLIAADDLELYAKLMGGMGRAEKARWATALGIDPEYDDCWHFRRYWREDLPLRTRLQVLDFHTFLPDDVLTKVDRVSMANSLEVRVPLLARPLIEFAFSVAEKVRFRQGRSKGLLRHAMKDLLPATIIDRPKRGFSAPPAHNPHSRMRMQEFVLTELFADAL